MRWLPFIFLAAATTVAPLIAQNRATDGNSDAVQNPGTPTCETGTARAYLESSGVKALILNNGGLFWDGRAYEYEVPTGSGLSSVFATSLWIGGMTNGELRMAGSRYGPYEFWPGPLGTDSESCSEMDRIYSVTDDDLDIWNETGVSTPDMVEWPWQLGAPVVDGDGITDNYDLSAGDYPELLGDQRLWWVMNDAGGVHEAIETEPLRMEVRASAFATDLTPSLGHTTFYKYELSYHGAEKLNEG